MPDIRLELLSLFNIVRNEWDGCLAKGKENETGDKYHFHVTLQPKSIPKEESVIAFLKQIENRDSCRLTLENTTRAGDNGSLLTICEAPDKVKYSQFAELFSEEDNIRADLDITKNISKEGICSVYRWDAFARFLLGDSNVTNSLGFLPDYLNLLFKDHPEGINFMVLDQEVNFATESIAFVNSEDDLVKFENRKETLGRYNGASLYMGRTKIKLLPGDFHADATQSRLPENLGKDVQGLFGRCETVYSLVYLADASWFEEKTLVVQLKKGGMQHRLPVAEIKNNTVIYELTDWVFDGDNSVERAEITRDILAAHCRNTEDILSIQDGIKESANSSYKIFAKKVVDQYIAVKRDVIKSIFESTKQVQELMSTLADTLGKNFVAVITVVISQVLAQNVNMQKLGTKDFVNKDFQIVVAIYFLASLAYLFATLHTVYTKWNSYRDRYYMIREQYEGLLYKDELNKAFDNDRLITKSKSGVFWYSCIISILWIMMITLFLMIALKANVWQLGIAVLVFAVLFVWAYKNYIEEKAPFFRLPGGCKKE